MTRKNDIKFNLKILENGKKDLEIKKGDIDMLPEVVRKYLGRL